ncbi:uncharacterized protein KY384_000634 [Bacidia gigantensis]|uniref:uncharacterized protein n=1 Tax=Bacidia gigantensis TaxID=2732470 RepID=UPI001D04B980|nr:uncharacterized protein KY384_000634 [Bacidia gigantensis]KAG8525874.1 hypothetical protein KY384_000634 [Bacidia gigantensis]
MSTSHGRPLSPGGRRIANAGRTSAGSFVTVPSHHDYTTTARTSRDYVPGPRASTERADGPRVVTLRQRSPPRKPRDDDYEVRPRIRTNSLDLGDSSKTRSVNLIDPRSSAKSSRPIITREIEKPKSPVPKAGGAQLEASYIVPASSSGRHHQRHSSLNMGDRLAVRDRERDRLYPNERTSKRDDRDYSYEYTNPKEQVLRDLAPPPQRRPRRESYTSARPTSMVDLDRYDKVYHRTDRDAPPPVAARGFDTINRQESRKQSIRAGADELKRKDSTSQRYPGDVRDDSRPYEPIKPPGPSRDDYVPYPEENSRHQRPRKFTIENEALPSRQREHVDDRDDRYEDRTRRHHHHHDENDHRKDIGERDSRHHRRDLDDGDRRERPREYEDKAERERRKEYDDRSERDRRRHYEERDERERRRDTEERGHRHRHDARERPDDDEGAGTHGGLLAAGGTAAAAGLAAEAVRRQKYKDDDIRGSKDSHGHVSERERAAENTGLSSEPEEEDREERRRRRRRQREIEEREERLARDRLQYEGQDEAGPKRIEAPPSLEHSLREQKSYERRPEDDQPRRQRHRHHRRQNPRSSDIDSRSDSSGPSDSDSGPDRAPRAPRVISPTNENAEAAAPKLPPKGILKTPRVRFPEEPQTTREGVAPLDAAKKGIPQEARWTKINRRLVNPEALEQEGVRFEEFPDHVIVLKVLSEEEISKYTQVTHEVRERRRLEQGSQASGSGSGTGVTGQNQEPGVERPHGT